MSYILVDVESEDAFIWNGDDCTPQTFENTEDVIQFIKDHELNAVVVTTVARVKPETRYKVERWH